MSLGMFVVTLALGCGPGTSISTSAELVHIALTDPGDEDLVDARLAAGASWDDLEADGLIEVIDYLDDRDLSAPSDLDRQPVSGGLYAYREGIIYNVDPGEIVYATETDADPSRCLVYWGEGKRNYTSTTVSANYVKVDYFRNNGSWDWQDNDYSNSSGQWTDTNNWCGSSCTGTRMKMKNLASSHTHQYQYFLGANAVTSDCGH